MQESIILELAKNLKIKRSQVETVLSLLEENTVPFIARYRKELTGGLDEENIRKIHKEYEYRKQLLDRKEDVIRLIDEKGMLTEELRAQILAAEKLVDVEDYYRPFKEKKKTKATEAIRKGLEPLADFIMTYPTEDAILQKANEHLNEEVTSTSDAIDGAKHIISERVSDTAEYRKWIRTHTEANGVLVTKVKKDIDDEKRVYEMYYDYQEPLKRIKLFRVLAINRAEKEKILTAKIDIDDEGIINYLNRKFNVHPLEETAHYVSEAIEDAYKRLIKPSIEREIRSSLSEKAEEQAIHIFSENLRSLLLQPPMKGKNVLGVDPAYRTGCKLAVVDGMGKMLAIDVIYPHQKYQGEAIAPGRIKDAKDKILNFLEKYNIDIVAIGNGTASRETEAFIVETFKEAKRKYFYIIVNEAGASVYSASELAKDEFPNLQVEERSAVSIARRLQDPLSELVKIDPQSIGVGQYQHDVTQAKLGDQLDFVVETVVNQVGVNVNTASPQLLSYVSGLSKTVAKNIVTYREDIGAFKKREALKKVPKLGAKSFEQAVGFLRILNGENPLDKTSIHPESYPLAEKLLKEVNASYEEIGTDIMKLKLSNVNSKDLAEKLNAGRPTVEDILSAFIAPLRDPRDDVDAPILKSDVLKLEDLTVGMELQGTVRNVVDFGVFVDCGVKDDGLVHISQLSKGYIKHPLDVVNVGDIVKVWVKDIDIKRSRLQLTMVKDKL
ncbi:Tex family protein [Liberiplasma polymorphum]|uniref:Tex family protein n=1 Tax=Liberiplasma polymorphum TaxID=3374570 RepID=UPI003771D67C